MNRKELAFEISKKIFDVKADKDIRDLRRDINTLIQRAIEDGVIPEKIKIPEMVEPVLSIDHPKEVCLMLMEGRK